MRRKGIRRKPGSAHGLHGPQGPLGIRPGHPYRWLSLDTFLELVLGARVGYLHPRGQNNDFPRLGRTRGVWGWKVAVQGPPMDLSDGPIAGLVERNS